MLRRAEICAAQRGLTDVVKRFDLGEFLFGQARDAIEDIRGKLIDEAWFGRRTSASGQSPAKSLGWELEPGEISPAQGDRFAPRPSFEAQWAPADRTEAGRDAPDRDHELDLDR